MRVVLAIVTALLGIVIGYCLVAAISYGVTGLGGMSDFEGGRAMFAGFVMGPIGAFFGFFTGCFAGWKLGRPPITPNRILSLFFVIILTVISISIVLSTG